MRLDTLELLACPSCDSPLAIDDGVPSSNVLEEGVLGCTSCEFRVPVVRGIPRFVPHAAYAESFGYQWGRFRTTQLDTAPDQESESSFKAKTGIDPAALAGKLVLDVGCGMGRFAAVCAEHGARILGVDISNAVEPALENLARFPGCDVIQADIFNLPLAGENFDVVYSIGVLHHTPDTKEAFLRLPRLLKPNGEIAVWVYSAETVDRLASGMKYVYRRFTPRIGHDALLRMCRAAVPLYRVHTAPGIGFVTRKLIPTSMHPDPEWRVLDTFDDYSPSYRWRHTFDEVLTWFAQAGLVQIRALEPRVAVRGVRNSRES